MNVLIDDTDLAITAATAITADAVATDDGTDAEPATDDAPKFTDQTLAIVSTLPQPTRSSALLPDGAGDAVTDYAPETLAAVKAIENEGSNIVVTKVSEKNSALEPDSPTQASARRERRDLYRASLKIEFPGITDEKLDRLCAKKAVFGGRQRHHPIEQTVCHPDLVFFWSVRINKDGVEEPRTDEDIEADALKQIRNDGGQVGPAARYDQLIDGASSRAAAGATINDHVTRRIKHIRIYVASATNELRRRRAVAAGIDPRTIDYLAVR